MVVISFPANKRGTRLILFVVVGTPEEAYEYTYRGYIELKIYIDGWLYLSSLFEGLVKTTCSIFFVERNHKPLKLITFTIYTKIKTIISCCKLYVT